MFRNSSAETAKVSSSKMLGMQGLHADAASTVDIVVVHGLTGHATETWTRNGVCWPRDLLPQVLLTPARVMTFGYDAGRFGGNANLDIEDAALQLISELERVRATPQERNRPLVFVAHSLGGIVLKQALIVSNNKPSLRHILASVAGVTFLATPHRGSALAGTADKLLRVNHVIPTPQKFIRSLKQNSPELASIGEDFKQIADQRSLPISTFYELLPTKGRLLCFSDVVVYKESALLNIQSEDALGVHVNHHEICKYDEVNDPVFRDLASRLRLFIERGPIHSSALVFLPWDTTPHFTGRRDFLQQMREGLIGNGRRIIVLHGDGGMGKTEVALKYAQENKHQYDYVFFMDSSSVRSLEAEFVALHNKLGLAPDDNREVDGMKQFFRRQRSWLVVLDNDDDWLALNQLGFPETSHGHIIITCRTREHTSDPRINKALRIRALDQKDARDLLFSRAGLDLKSRAQWDHSAKSLIKRMGCQPLAVDSAAAYILCSDLTIDDYLEVLRSRKLSKRVLTYRPKSSKYQTSVESILQITLEEIQRSPDAYKLLKLLVWLDKSKTTVSFLKGAVSPQPCWGSNGEPSERHPQQSYVPEDLIDLINGPDFIIALKELKSYALIADDDKFDEGSTTSKGTIVLHPLTYSYVRGAFTADQMIENATRALSLVVHTYPTVQAGLDKSKFPAQEVVPQVFQANSNRMYLEERNMDLAEALRGILNGGELSFADRTAEMLFEAIRGYGEGKDEVDRMLLKLLKELLKFTSSVYLQARLWCTRLPLEFYSRGKFTEGCEAADEFVQRIESQHKRQDLSERDNAQMGFLRHLSVEYKAREKDLSDSEVWSKRAAYIDVWEPRDPKNPSQLEKYAMGMGVRMRGKLAKDYGLFKEAYYSLKLFIEEYAQRGSREEGWAIGDFGQVVLELEDTDEAPEILQDLRTNGTNFGEKMTFSSTTALCEIVSYICSRAVEYRMFERGHLTQQDRENVRESDTVFLEIAHAASVLRTGRIHPESFNDAEQELQGLRKRFEKIRANGISWHDDQIREFSVLAYLAQISHLQKDWEEAQSRWKQAVDYGRLEVKEWGGDNFYIEVAKYSLADVQLNAGGEVNTIISDLGDTVRRLDKEKETWMLGVGTYWLDYVKQSMGPKLVMEGMRSIREREMKEYEKGL